MSHFDLTMNHPELTTKYLWLIMLYNCAIMIGKC